MPGVFPQLEPCGELPAWESLTQRRDGAMEVMAAEERKWGGQEHAA
jgi:hypothetical protein